MHVQERLMAWSSYFAERGSRLWPALIICVSMQTSCAPLMLDQPATQFSSHEGAEGGIGGTGIVGVVTDFGSVVVNGRHVDVKPDTPIRLDGEHVPAGALRVGQVVMIDSVGKGSELLSRSIDIRREVIGPITDVGSDKGTMTIMDQPVVFAEDALVNVDPKRGELASVSGFRLADRTIVATRLDRIIPSTAPAHLYGRYNVVDDQVRIDGVIIKGIVASPTLQGREVFVQGLWTDGKLTPVQFNVLPRAPLDRLETLSIAGFFDRPTETVSSTLVDRASDKMGSVKLSDGRVISFGIFEGNWSAEDMILEVDEQISVDNVMKTPNRGSNR